MKPVHIFLLCLLVLLTGEMQAQYGRSRGTWLTPKLRSVSLDGLVLGVPALGLGADLDLARGYEYSDSSSSYGFGARAWSGAGYSESFFGSKFAPNWYIDGDILLYGSLVVENFSAIGFIGYGYRIWNGAESPSSGHRVKFGIELGYMIYPGRITARLRIMGAGLAPGGSTEVGPLALGVSFGWFKLH